MDADAEANPGLAPIVDLAAAPEYSDVKFNNCTLPMDQAYNKAVAYVEGGAGNWGKTNVHLLDPTTFEFSLSCATCGKSFALANPVGFWGTHSKKCTDSKHVKF